MLWIVQRCTAW